jgi:group II intron reverse transcriptase/maturase
MSTQTKLITYSEIISAENLSEGLKRTRGSSAPGLDGDVKANFTVQKIEKLHKELASQKYQPKPAKRINIPKPDGGTRPLGIASQRDKVVQAAILNRLEPILEAEFLESSQGFRPGRNCHGALREIKQKWQNATWIINIDVVKYFDTIQHEILLSKLSPYMDQPSKELIRKLLKAGYVDLQMGESVFNPILGTPQGSLISPILANLYLHELDCLMEDTLIPKYTDGDARKFVAGYHNRKNLTAAEKTAIEGLGIEGLAKAARALKHNEWANAGLPGRDPHDEGFRRCYYVRYADDFMIGFSGPKIEAEEIQAEIIKLLEESLKLKVNVEKSSINHSGNRDIKFLGMYVRYLPAKLTTAKAPNQNVPEAGVSQIKRISINSAQLRIPVKKLLERAIERGYATKRKSGSIRATSCRKLSSLEDKQIVQRYSSVIRGIMNYYSCANRLSDLWAVVSIYRKSCALTLADKHKLKTAAKAYKIYGPKLRINDPTNSKKPVELFYPESLKTTTNFKLSSGYIGQHLLVNDPMKGSYRQNPKTNITCQFKGCLETKGLEEHHVNPQQNISDQLTPFEHSLISKARKTVTLCKRHHAELHLGERS